MQGLSPDLILNIRRLQRIYTPNYQPFSSWTDTCVGVKELAYLSPAYYIGIYQEICKTFAQAKLVSRLFKCFFLSFCLSLRETVCMSAIFISLNLLFPCYFPVICFKCPCNCYVWVPFCKGPLIREVSGFFLR